ncbi:hypothetical protein CBX96_08575 [Shewanella sp. BC20]|uniref:glycosyltransferase n=1 Tax=Shewanella sp. BC20 TaxID=2004459 RepID=UPI000D65DD7C|nr:glycosyltransferase [Shewanella sp. BC20]PWF63878.1 hypothetical protein CBX96_08575 [Shewanella sp. BC20]
MIEIKEKTLCVVMPFYIGTDYKTLMRAIRSIAEQFDERYELLLVCDGIKPEYYYDLQTIIKNTYSNLSFEILHYHKNMGPGYARDFAIKRTNCKYIAIMDSDDIARPYRLKKQLDFLLSNLDVSVHGGYIQEFNVYDSSFRLRTVPIYDSEIKSVMKIKSPINNVTAMFNREHYLNCGGFPFIRSSEDYCLWGRFALHGYKFHNVPEILVDVEFDPKVLSRRCGWLHFMNDCFTQRTLLHGNLISFKRYLINILKYFIFRFLPGSIKLFLYRHFLRVQ